MISFKQYLTESNLSRTQIADKIGKTRMLAMAKHPFYQRHVGVFSGMKEPVFKHETDNLGHHHVYAAATNEHMVKFDFFNHRVTNAHLFHWNGARHSNGQKMWEYVKSYKNDDE